MSIGMSEWQTKQGLNFYFKVIFGHFGALHGQNFMSILI